MKKTKLRRKRCFALFLAFVLCLSVPNVSVFAEEPDSVVTDAGSESNPATEGGTEATSDESIEDAGGTDEIPEENAGGTDSTLVETDTLPTVQTPAEETQGDNPETSETDDVQTDVLDEDMVEAEENTVALASEVEEVVAAEEVTYYAYIMYSKSNNNQGILANALSNCEWPGGSGMTEYFEVTIPKVSGNPQIDATVSGIVPKLDGYKFKGWTTTRKGSTVEYRPGDPVTLEGATVKNGRDAKGKTLYSVWEVDTGEPETPEKPEEYTVIYKDSDGTEIQKFTGLKEGDSTPGCSHEKIVGIEKKQLHQDEDFDGWTPEWESKVGGNDANIVYTAKWKAVETYSLIIHYCWYGADKGKETVAETYTDQLKREDSYEVTSPTPEKPFNYSIVGDNAVKKGTMMDVADANRKKEFWVYYTPLVKVNHIYRENGKEVGRDTSYIGEGDRKVYFNQTLEADSIDKITTYEGERYTFSSSSGDVTLPGDPTQLTSQPEINLYYEKEKVPFIIYYQWNGADAEYKKAAEDYSTELYRGESYSVESPTLDVPFEYSVTHKMISGTVASTSPSVVHWVTYTPNIKVNHIYRTNGEVTRAYTEPVLIALPLNKTLTAESITKLTNWDDYGEVYEYTESDDVTLPGNPAELTEQPVLNLYYDRTVEPENPDEPTPPGLGNEDDPTPTPPGGGGDDEPTPPEPGDEDEPVPPTPPAPQVSGTEPVVPTATPTIPIVTPVVPTVIPVAPALAAVAPAPAAIAEAELTELNEEAVPLANTLEAEDGAGLVELEEGEVPLAAGNNRSWALINFALMNLAIFESLMLLIGYFVKTKNDKDEEEEKRKLKKKGVFRILSLPIAAISLIAFILTEDISLPTALVDKYTVIMLLIAIVQTIMVPLSNKKYEDEDEQEA